MTSHGCELNQTFIALILMMVRREEEVSRAWHGSLAILVPLPNSGRDVMQKAKLVRFKVRLLQSVCPQLPNRSI